MLLVLLLLTCTISLTQAKPEDCDDVIITVSYWYEKITGRSSCTDLYQTCRKLNGLE